MTTTEGRPAPVATETAAPGELLAARTLFEGPSDTVPLGLYLDVRAGTVARERASLTVDPQTHASANTYFGRFPAAYWHRWTVATTVTVRLATTGAGRVELWSSDTNGGTRIVDAARAGGTVDLHASLTGFADGGALWLELRTEADPMTVADVRWLVDAPARHRPASVVICTYNRADDCLTTLAALASDPECLGRLEHIYVVDQGTDTVQSRERFDGVRSALGGRLRYLRQPNLGGAGGFSRGMYEILGDGDSGTGDSDVLLMDDDVLLDPELVVRVTAFANRTTEPTLVGGQMLRLLHPSYLFAGAEWANLDEFVPGKVKDGALDDADLLAPGQDLGERRIDADYNAWWCCLIPSEVIARIGYPLPLFFQWDDIEFGYRAKENGFVTVTLPGAGLWHLDFDWKDLDDWKYYFSIRNAMICAALHGRLDPAHSVRVLFALLARCLVGIQYGMAATLLKAVTDFLAGPDVLGDGGAAAAAEVRALRAGYPDTVAHPLSDIPRSVPQVRPEGYHGRKLGEPRRSNRGVAQRVLMVKRLAQLASGRFPGLAGTMAADESFWWHVSRFDTAIVTDSAQNAVRIRTRDRAEVLRLFREGVTVLRRAYRELPEAKRTWQAAAPRLTSRENWTRLYRL